MNALEAKFEFVIETGQDHFTDDRELCAFCTGMVGACGVGGDEAKQFYSDMGLMDHLLSDKPEDPWSGVNVETCDEDLDNPFSGYVCDLPDDHGCFRPVSSTGGAVTIHFSRKPTKYQRRLVMARAKDFRVDNEPVKILGFRLIQRTVIISLRKVWDAHGVRKKE